MKSDEIQLVREFASELPPLDEKAKTHAYLYATGQERSHPGVGRWPHSSKRVKYYAAIALACTAAVIAAVSLTDGRTPANQLGSSALGVSSLPTVARPLPAGSSQVSLGRAANVLGASLTLPDSAQAPGVGAVWSSRAAHSPVGESVAVTFPSQGFDVRYTRPVPYQDPLANYESYVHSTPSAQVVYLDGVPTLTDTSSRPDGSTWNSVEFVSHGTMIAVIGTADQSTLQNAARSILNQAAS